MYPCPIYCTLQAVTCSLVQPEYANVCFWYIPPSLRRMEDGPEFWQKLHHVSVTCCLRLTDLFCVPDKNVKQPLALLIITFQQTGDLILKQMLVRCKLFLGLEKSNFFFLLNIRGVSVNKYSACYPSCQQLAELREEEQC